MPVAVGVPAKIELRTGEPGGRLQVFCELIVREGIDDGRRFLAVGFGSLGRAHHRIREHADCESRRSQGRILEASRGGDRALGPLVHLLVLGAPDEVHGELRHEPHRLGRALVGKALECAREAGTRLLMSSEEAFDRRTRARERRAQRVRALRHDAERLHKSVVAVREMADSR